jgi:hypothetical protein
MPGRRDEFLERQVRVKRVRLLLGERSAADDRIYEPRNVRIQGPVLRWL